MSYKLVVVFGDTHAGSTVALSPPSFSLRDEGTYHANEFQQWAWDHWLKFWDEIAREREKAEELIIVANGDLLEGRHHQIIQIIGNDLTEQIRLGLETFHVINKLSPEHKYATMGTPCHNGRANSAEDLFAEILGCRPYGNQKYLWPMLPLDIWGTTFDIAHHAPSGRLPHTRHSATMRYAVRIVWEYWSEGIEPPTLVFRGHNHYCSDSGDNERTRVIYVPSWQGVTDFGTRIAPGNRLPIGAVFVKCFDDGTHEVFKRSIKPKRDKRIVI